MNSAETKLKIVAEEIKEILRKHDLAGAVALHSPGHGEYFVHLNPSYSCAYIYNDNEIRLYSKIEDYKSKSDQIQKQSDTANMLKILTDITALNFAFLHEISKVADIEFGAVHK